MSFRRFLRRLLVIALVLLACGFVAEGLLRWALFHGGSTFASWRKPELYTQVFHVNDHQPGSDDRDKLRMRWGLVKPDTSNTHPVLGWCGDLDPRTLLPKDFDPADTRFNVVMLGSMWRDANGNSSHTLFEQDSVFRGVCRLVDLSVKGFGPDQDLLLAERTLGTLKHSAACIAIDPRALDLTARTFPLRPKPCYALSSRGMHAQAPADMHDPSTLHTRCGSLLYHCLSNALFGDSVASISATKMREQDLQWTGLTLISALLDSTRALGARNMIILDDRVEGWMMKERVDKIVERCGMASTPYRLMSELLMEVGTNDPGEAMRHELLLWTTVPGHLEQVRAWNKMYALVFKPDQELNEFDLRLKGIMKDTNWMKEERRKAHERGVPLTTILEEDARYTLEMDKQKK